MNPKHEKHEARMIVIELAHSQTITVRQMETLMLALNATPADIRGIREGLENRNFDRR